jgi:hypothetical protein
VNSSAPLYLLTVMVATGCATRTPLVAQGRVGQAAGNLVVYSATYAPTVEQSEYPVHTDYTIATPTDKVIEHVANGAGPFSENPARVSLPTGAYHIRAQYSKGGFVVVPVVIEADKTTVVDLDGERLRLRPDAPREMVRQSDGEVIGWWATQ